MNLYLPNRYKSPSYLLALMRRNLGNPQTTEAESVFPRFNVDIWIVLLVGTGDGAEFQPVND